MRTHLKVEGVAYVLRRVVEEMDPDLYYEVENGDGFGAYAEFFISEYTSEFGEGLSTTPPVLRHQASELGPQ